MYTLKSDQVPWTQLPPSSLCGTAVLRSEDGHDVTVPVASLVLSPLIRSIMADLHSALTPFVLICPVDVEVLKIAGEVFNKGVVKVKDEQVHHEVQQLLELMEVSAILSCHGIDQEPANVGNAWMTKLNLENVIKSDIKLESLYDSDDELDNQKQESSDAGILLELESAMGSGGPRQREYAHEGDGHLVKEDNVCKATLDGKTEKNSKCSINQHNGTQREETQMSLL